MKKKPRARVEKRKLTREAEKQLQALDRIAQLSRGGSSEFPIDVEFTSEIEVAAAALRCARCAASVHVRDHEAVTIAQSRLRLVTTECQVCGSKRKIYFRVLPRLN